MQKENAVVLLSGGLDSATVLAIAASRGYACHCLSFAYGQRNGPELAAAEQIARKAGAASHRVMTIDLRAYGGSALTADIDVPKDGAGEGIPTTYVPARNTIFLAHGLALAEVLGARELFIGVNSVDFSGYPDCRPEFIDCFQRLAALATKQGVEGNAVKISAPLQFLDKGEIIRLGVGLGVDYSLTLTCYDPTADGLACGACEACRLRRNGFAKAETPDPTRYKPQCAMRNA